MGILITMRWWTRWQRVLFFDAKKSTAHQKLEDNKCGDNCKYPYNEFLSKADQVKIRKAVCFADIFFNVD